jgi:hypothetical protein
MPTASTSFHSVMVTTTPSRRIGRQIGIDPVAVRQKRSSNTMSGAFFNCPRCGQCRRRRGRTLVRITSASEAPLVSSSSMINACGIGMSPKQRGSGFIDWGTFVPASRYVERSMRLFQAV